MTRKLSPVEQSHRDLLNRQPSSILADMVWQESLRNFEMKKQRKRDRALHAKQVADLRDAIIELRGRAMVRQAIKAGDARREARIEPANVYLERMRKRCAFAEPHKIPRPFILDSHPSLPTDEPRHRARQKD